MTIPARLAAATGPDRELDLAIAQALVPDVVVWLATKDAPFPGAPSTYWKYTGSIDAVIALVERMLPGCGWHGGGLPSSGDAWSALRPDGSGVEFSAEAPTLPLAILKSLFYALEAYPKP